MISWKVNNEDIKALNDVQLVDLLRTLLLLEARSLNISASNVHVPHNIRATDGGEDGRISCVTVPQGNQFITHALMIFQVKATEMPAKSCVKELFQKGKGKKNKLQPCVQEVITNNGCYVLFCNEDMVQQAVGTTGSGGIQGRINVMQQAIPENAGHINLQIYDASKMSTWVNQYIAAVILVKRYNQKTLPENMMTWKEWSQSHGLSDKKYIEDEELLSLREKIPSYLKNKGNCIRITGFPGVGKTFFAHSIFNFKENKNLVEEVVYIDASYSKNILPSIHMWLRDNQSCLLIIDNCDKRYHDFLAQEVKKENSRITLLTIAEGLEESKISATIDCILKLTPSRNIDSILISEIGDDVFSLLHHINQKTKGNPKFSLDYFKYIKTGASNYDGNYFENLIFKNNKSERIIFKVIMACALFEKIDFEIGESDEFETVSIQFLAEQMNIDVEEFYQISMRYLFKPGLASWKLRKGIGCFVLPQMANKFAIDWWYENSPRKIASFIWNIMEKECAREFFERLKPISDNSTIQEKLEAVCDELKLQKLDLSDCLNLKLIGLLVKVTPEKCQFILDNYEDIINSLNPNYFINNNEFLHIIIELSKSQNLFKKATTALLKICANNKLIFTEYASYSGNTSCSEEQLQQNSKQFDLNEEYTFLLDRRNWRRTISFEFVFSFKGLMYYIESELICEFLRDGLSRKNQIERRITIEIILELFNDNFGPWICPKYSTSGFSNIVPTFYLKEYKEKILQFLRSLYKNEQLNNETVLDFLSQLRKTCLQKIVTISEETRSDSDSNHSLSLLQTGLYAQRSIEAESRLSTKRTIK